MRPSPPIFSPAPSLALLALTAFALGADEPPASSPAPAPAATATPAAPADDTGKAIRAAVDAFTQAFQKGDAEAIAALFTEDGEAVGDDGEPIRGRDALRDHYAARFAENPGDRAEADVEEIRRIAPGVVRQAGVSRIVPSDGGPPAVSRYESIHVLRDGKWLVASLRELPDDRLTPHDRLRELEWLVGDWVEESDDAVVFTSIAWDDDKNFLLRSFDVRVQGKPALTGTQRIGWDPLTRQIKHWVFDSRGGHGEGLWMRAGNQWVIKATGVRPDGRVATATQVLTYVNNDALRWKSIDRTLGTEIADDIDEVVMLRQPPKPK